MMFQCYKQLHFLTQQSFLCEICRSLVYRAGSGLKPKPRFSVKLNRNRNLGSDGGPGRFLGLARLTEDTPQSD